MFCYTYGDFYAPGSNDRGHIVFVRSVCLSVCLFVCLSVCLSVVNFNLHYNFWTVRDRDFIFGMHTLLKMPFQMTPRCQWPCDLDFDLCAKNSFFGLCCRRVSQTHLDFFFCNTFFFVIWVLYTSFLCFIIGASADISHIIWKCMTIQCLGDKNMHSKSTQFKIVPLKCIFIILNLHAAYAIICVTEIYI